MRPVTGCTAIRVIDTLWPDSDLAAAANNFHQTLYGARQVLDPLARGCLRLEESMLSLSGGEAHALTIDVEQFETAAAVAAGAKDRRDPAVIQAALAFYPGELLPDDPYEEWTIQRRDELRQVYLRLLFDLAFLQESSQNYPAGMESLQRVLSADKSSEEAHAGLMRLYALSGQRQQALRQYQTLRQVLKTELDAEPSPSTTQLYAAIQAGRFAAAEGASLTPAAAAPQLAREFTSARPHNLPAQLTSFIGREAEIQTLIERIQSHRLVTLTGAGGTGKTRLALQVAEGMLDHFSNGVFLVELAALSNSDLVPQACLQSLDLIQQSGILPSSTLLRFLEKKHLLLILDNCEHVIGACTQLADALLKGCPDLHILATSREILSIPGESPWRVPPLTFPDPQVLPDLEKLLRFEAIRLFVERAEAVSPEFRLTSDNAAIVAQISLRLDGIPLAIELAAARMRMLTAEQIASRLDNTFRLLTGGSKAALPRQQTLRRPSIGLTICSSPKSACSCSAWLFSAGAGPWRSLKRSTPMKMGRKLRRGTA